MRYIHCAYGAWSFLVEEETGFVREVRYGSERLAVAIYSAVRAPDWGTYPVALSDLRWGEAWCSWVSQAEGAPFRWKTEVEVGGDGFRMSIDGTPSETFQTCRTGLCLLHPLSVCGTEVVVRHVDGSEERSVFPTLVAPHQPFMEMAGLRYTAPSGVTVDIALEGEVFETEDQRNWSDASFKTYCHRLGDGRPYTLQAGQRVRQEVRIRCEGEPSPTAAAGEVEATMPALLVWLDTPPVDALLALREAEVSRVATDAPDVLSLAAEVGVAADLRLPTDVWAQLKPFAPPAGGSVLWLVSDRWSEQAEAVVQQLRQEWQLLGWELGYGSSANFAELNRSRPPMNTFQWLATAASPQVHTFDAWSILQNAESFADIGATMRSFAGEAGLCLGPLSFESRFTGKDARADSPLAAAYLLLAIASIASGGFHRVIAGRASQVLNEGSPVGALLRDWLRVSPRTVRYAVKGDLRVVQFIGARGNRVYVVNPSPQEVERIPPFTFREEA
jgi:hypothetical protein